jgi:hypothetical protein
MSKRIDNEETKDKHMEFTV